ncbi:unnamed protein product, partial [Rotaria sp. Silwood1]
VKVSSILPFILQDPIHLTCCSDRQCQSCHEFQHRTIIKCPQYLTKTSQYQMMIDRGFNMDMQSLPIACYLFHWVGILPNYQEHLDQIHRNPKCEYYHEQFVSVENLNEHKISKC